MSQGLCQGWKKNTHQKIRVLSLSLPLKITKFYEAIKKFTSLDFKMILKVHLHKYSPSFVCEMVTILTQSAEIKLK